jgi:hypothetical protein
MESSMPSVGLPVRSRLAAASREQLYSWGFAQIDRPRKMFVASIMLFAQLAFRILFLFCLRF